MYSALAFIRETLSSFTHRVLFFSDILLDFSPPLLLWLPCFWHFPTFTPLLKEVGAICLLIGRISLFVQQMSHSSVKSGLVFPHYLLIHSLPEISIFCWLRSDLQINIFLPPPLLFPESLCFARLTFWEWELRLTNCSPLTVLSTCTHLCEKQTKPWCYDAPYQTYPLLHIIPRGLSSIFYSCTYPLPSWVVESAVLIVSPFSGRWSEGFRLWRNLI